MRRGKDPKLEAMAKVPLFAHCSKRELAEIAKLADEIDLPEGKTLMREGERGREFFVILEGEVDVRRGSRLLTSRRSGVFVGEMALISDVPRNATVTVTKPARALVLTHHAFNGMLDKNPEIRAKVMRAFAERLVDAG